METENNTKVLSGNLLRRSLIGHSTECLIISTKELIMLPISITKQPQGDHTVHTLSFDLHTVFTETSSTYAIDEDLMARYTLLSELFTALRLPYIRQVQSVIEDLIVRHPEESNRLTSALCEVTKLMTWANNTIIEPVPTKTLPVKLMSDTNVIDYLDDKDFESWYSQIRKPPKGLK